MQGSNHFFATEPVGKLLFRFSIPCILSLLVSSLYNIVDQIFIGWGVGYLGNGATNVVFPITIIALSFALLIGDGCAAYLSLCQGRKDDENAHRGVGNAVVAIIAVSLVMTLCFVLLEEQILWAFGATENTIAYAREYYEIIVIGLPFFIFGNALNSIIRADSSPKFAMLSTFAGCIINVVLDPIAIFVLGWEMKGAALATIIGQIVTALLAVYYLFRTKSFRLMRKSFRPKAEVLGRIFPLGVSSFLTQVSIVILMAMMNNVLVKYGAMSKYGADIPLTVVGIVMKVFQIVVSIVVGIAAGAQPIIGYNYGAGLNLRVREIFKKMIIAVLCVGIISMLIFELLPLQVIGIFGSEEGLYNEFAVLCFRIYLSSIALCSTVKAICIFLQALGKPAYSMGLSLLREIVLCVPLILLLPMRFGLMGVLYSAPIADVISIAVAVVFIRKTFRGISGADASRLNAAASGQ